MSLTEAIELEICNARLEDKKWSGRTGVDVSDVPGAAMVAATWGDIADRLEAAVEAHRKSVAKSVANC